MPTPLGGRRTAASLTLTLTAVLALGTAAPALAQTARPAAVTAASSAATTVTYAQWIADVTAVTNQAQTYLTGALASVPAGEKPAIVLDIDNTALASYFNSSYPVPATPPVLALAKYAAAHGAKIFFVTGRPDIIDLFTKNNLTSVGYQVDGLYSRNPVQLFESLQTFKTGARQQITADGYTIVANIGNSQSDLDGGYAQATFKLPDYNGLLD
ncbi:MAG TPA: HAD family acid phosphatase [Actinocrinis sp.]|nr:HAD family acid phosphatase [Actinocrinis sp.]